MIVLFALGFYSCSDDGGPTDGTPPPNSNTVHDTVAVHSPPPAGGTLPGYWSTALVAPGEPSPWAISQDGFRGIHNQLFQTDLRIDGSRVWFQADEPTGGGWRHRFNGTMTDSTITGWIGTCLWSEWQGEQSIMGYDPITFRRRS